LLQSIAKESLGEGQGLEESLLLCLQSKDGHEGHGDDQEGEEGVTVNLMDGLDEDLSVGSLATPKE